MKTFSGPVLSLVFGLILTLGPSFNIQAKEYQINNTPKGVSFTVTKLTQNDQSEFGPVDIPGHFSQYQGSFSYDESTGELKNIDVRIDSKSIDTGIEKRDKHLRSKDFFHVENYPYLTFKTQAGQTFKVPLNQEVTFKGLLKIKDTQKPVDLKVKLTKEGDKVLVNASTAFKRSEWGMSFNNQVNEGMLKGLVNKFKHFIGQNVIGDNVRVNIQTSGK